MKKDEPPFSFPKTLEEFQYAFNEGKRMLGGHREGADVGEGGVEPWMGHQFINRTYVSISGLLKGTSAVL